jgi:7,8-dihydroneopterin aldolase/epimerase/oxygenase
MSLYRIELTGLKAFGHHGVAEFERQYGQEFVVDVAIQLDASEAAATDDVSKTAHYGLLADAIVGDVKTNPVNLLETLVTRLAKLVLAFDSRIETVDITVHKPNAPIDHAFSDVSVSLRLGRSDA